MKPITLASLPALCRAYQDLQASFRVRFHVCAASGCLAGGGEAVRQRLVALADRAGLHAEVAVLPSGCLGCCGQGPALVVEPGDVFYPAVTPEKAGDIFEAHVFEGGPAARHLPRRKGRPVERRGDLPFFRGQTPVLTRHRAGLDPTSLDAFIGHGGYAGLARALAELGPEGVIDLLRSAGLRGRGGAGFPTADKWAACRAAAGREKFVVANGDEGDPGAYTDRSLLESDPHRVLEGLLLAGFAVGASQGVIYLREEYALAVERVETALAQARARGVLGRSVLGTGLAFDARVVRGAGALVAGESTALLAAIEGLPVEPRGDYVPSTEKGLFGRPTVVNNVETLAAAAVLLGPDGRAWASEGLGRSRGTKLFSVVGKAARTGVVEVPLGVPLRRIVEDLCGGASGRRPLKAVQAGGPAGGWIPASLLDLPVTYEHLAQAGGMMCTGGIILLDDTVCAVEASRASVEFLLEESCGRCTPCREGLGHMLELLTGLCEGRGSLRDIERLEELCEVLADAAQCGLGRAAAQPVRSTLRYFRPEYEAHVRERRCPAGACRALSRLAVDPERCTGCGRCRSVCPSGAIRGGKGEAAVIDAERCTGCGACRGACPRDAVVVLGAAERPSQRQLLRRT